MADTGALNKVTALVAASFAVILVACAGSDDDDGASSASALTVVEACSGTVTCDLGDEGMKSAALSKDASGCHLGGITFAPGGAVVADDLHGMVWTSTGTTVSVCADGAPDVCIQCTAATKTSASASASAPAPAAGKCTGYADFCGSLGPGTCARQDGCSMDLDFEWCRGAAKSCDEYDSKTSCEYQSACH